MISAACNLVAQLVPGVYYCAGAVSGVVDGSLHCVYELVTELRRGQEGVRVLVFGDPKFACSEPRLSMDSGHSDSCESASSDYNSPRSSSSFYSASDSFATAPSAAKAGLLSLLPASNDEAQNGGSGALKHAADSAANEQLRAPRAPFVDDSPAKLTKYGEDGATLPQAAAAPVQAINMDELENLWFGTKPSTEVHGAPRPKRRAGSGNRGRWLPTWAKAQGSSPTKPSGSASVSSRFVL